jgi:hypothetical protein
MKKYLFFSVIGFGLLVIGFFLQINFIPVADFDLLTLAEILTLQEEVALAPKWGFVLMAGGFLFLLWTLVLYYQSTKGSHRKIRIAALLLLWLICAKVLCFPSQKEWVEGEITAVYEDGYASFQTTKQVDSRYGSEAATTYYFETNHWKLAVGQNVAVLTSGRSFHRFNEIFLPVIDVQPLSSISRSQD